MLKEAEVREGGERLGEVGSRLVAETFIGVLLNDPESYLAKDASWDPSKKTPGSGGPLKLSDGRTIKKIGDLLEFAGVKSASPEKDVDGVFEAVEFSVAGYRFGHSMIRNVVSLPVEGQALGMDEDQRTVGLAFATTRKIEEYSDLYFSGERSRKMTYGMAAVRIPKSTNRKASSHPSSSVYSHLPTKDRPTRGGILSSGPSRFCLSTIGER